MSALDLACSRYVGIVVHVDELLPGPGDSTLTHIVAVEAGDRDAGGTGYAADPAVARAAAIGEALERYAARHVPPNLPVAAAAETPDAVEPGRFALFASEQHTQPGFPFTPFTPSTPVRWTEGRSLVDGRRVSLPAQLVYLGRPGKTAETSIGYATSNGLACGPTFADAAVAALLELLERDAFLIAWRARLSLPLVVDDDPALQTWERRYLASTGLHHDLVDLSCFHGVATVLAVVRDDVGSLSVGAAAAPRARTACEKALAEAYAGHGAARRMRDDPDAAPFRADFSDVVEFADHIRLYADPDHACRAAFLVSSSERRSVRELPDLGSEDAQDILDSLAAGLVEKGIETYAVDVTTTDVRDLDLHVVRVVAPELCPLDVRHDACFLGGERLRRAPAHLGLRPDPLSWNDLNRDPHPFP